MADTQWILCGNKTRVRIRRDTELKNFPLYYPKCSRESLVEVKNLEITVIKFCYNEIGFSSQLKQ